MRIRFAIFEAIKKDFWSFERAFPNWRNFDVLQGEFAWSPLSMPVTALAQNFCGCYGILYAGLSHLSKALRYVQASELPYIEYTITEQLKKAKPEFNDSRSNQVANSLALKWEEMATFFSASFLSNMRIDIPKLLQHCHLNLHFSSYYLEHYAFFCNCIVYQIHEWRRSVKDDLCIVVLLSEAQAAGLITKNDFVQPLFNKFYLLGREAGMSIWTEAQQLSEIANTIKAECSKIFCGGFGMGRDAAEICNAMALRGKDEEEMTRFLTGALKTRPEMQLIIDRQRGATPVIVDRCLIAKEM